MKIIELLNKIANGEEVPKKIKWGEFILEWEELGYHDYKFLETGNHLLFQGFATSVLNDEIEIIEDTPKEDKEIEKLEKYYEEHLDYEDKGEYYENILKVYGNGEYTIHEDMSFVIDKINEIIEVINNDKSK